MSALGPRAAGSAVGKQEPEWVVVLLVVALLAAGFFMMTAVTGQKVAYENDVLSFSHPAGWNRNTTFGATSASGADLTAGELVSLYGVRDLRARSAYKSEIGVLALDMGGDATDPVRMALARLQFAYAGELGEFKVLGTEKVKVGDVECVVLRYAFVADPNPDSPFAPVVVEASELIVPVAGKNKVMVVRLRYDESRTPDTAAVFGELMASLKLKAGK